MDHTVPIRFSGYAGMDIGRDNGGVVDRAYEDRKPFSFTGTIEKVVFEIEPHASKDETRRAPCGASPRNTSPCPVGADAIPGVRRWR